MAKRTYELKETTKSIFPQDVKDAEFLETLPVTHKRDLYTAIKMLSENKISVEECDVFKKPKNETPSENGESSQQEELVYLFYGRAPYYIAHGISSRTDNLYYPICFIMDFNDISIDKVFPFDSGAFAETFYDNYVHENMDVNDFSIMPNIKHIKEFIKFFYDNNDNYYRTKNKTVANPDPTCLELESYVNILNRKGADSFDSRSQTIEIISKTDITLSECLKAIIVPIDFKRTYPKIKELKDNGVDIVTYNTFGDEPGSYNGSIRSKLYDYLKNHNLL